MDQLWPVRGSVSCVGLWNNLVMALQDRHRINPRERKRDVNVTPVSVVLSWRKKITEDKFLPSCDIDSYFSIFFSLTLNDITLVASLSLSPFHPLYHTFTPPTPHSSPHSVSDMPKKSYESVPFTLPESYRRVTET